MWEKSLGSKEYLENRLKLENLDIDNIKNLLNEHEYREVREVPVWIKELEKISRNIECGKEKNCKKYLEKNNIEYAEFIIYFVEYVYSEINLKELFKEEPMHVFLKSIQEIISQIINKTLNFEFNNYKSLNELVLNKNILYTSFIYSLKKDGMQAFWYEYSYLARILMNFCIRAAENINIVLNRLVKDILKTNRLK